MGIQREGGYSFHPFQEGSLTSIVTWLLSFAVRIPFEGEDNENEDDGGYKKKEKEDNLCILGVNLTGIITRPLLLSLRCEVRLKWLVTYGMEWKTPEPSPPRALPSDVSSAPFPTNSEGKANTRLLVYACVVAAGGGGAPFVAVRGGAE